MFLARINKDLDEVRGCILGHKHLQSIREVFLEVQREKVRRCVMLHLRDVNPVAQHESLAVFSRGVDTDGD